MKTVLTGVKPTHFPHIGNYLGAIRPALKMANEPGTQGVLFVADYHALTFMHEPKKMSEYTYSVAATWMACGLDPSKTLIYRQSDVPEIFELAWILSCFTPKGLMNRAHAYKAKLAENQESGKADLDYGVNVGLYTYPVLMAADILAFEADEVPVGEDQVQHIEIARDIAEKINRTYGEVLKLPKYIIQKEVKTVPGLDGRKMSKSYGNHIPLFESSKKMRKLVMKIKTDSTEPEEPKNPDDSILMDLYKEFASGDQVEDLKQRYHQGIGWGYVKQDLFEVMDSHIEPLRNQYNELMNDTNHLDNVLKVGAEQARERTKALMQRLRSQIGIS